MNKKQIVEVTCVAIEVLSIVNLTRLALKRNKQCYEAQTALIDAEIKNLVLEIEGHAKDRKIEKLEEEIKELKK